MKYGDGLDCLHLAQPLAIWGIEKLERVTKYPRTSIYQWRPSRGPVPPEAALRVCEMPDAIALRLWVEKLCPGLPWHLLYGGRDRRSKYDGAATSVEEAIKQTGVTLVACAAERSRQNIYEAMRYPICPVWLALALEAASEARYLVEDIRSDLPWWPLYQRYQDAYPLSQSTMRHLQGTRGIEAR